MSHCSLLIACFQGGARDCNQPQMMWIKRHADSRGTNLHISVCLLICEEQWENFLWNIEPHVNRTKTPGLCKDLAVLNEIDS